MFVWSTPDTPADIEMSCRSITVPTVLLDSVLGAIAATLKSDNWIEDGSMSIDDTIQYMNDMWNTMKECTMIGQTIFGVWESTPENTLPCDGSVYLRADYPELYNVIASNLIIDANSFRVPDMSNSFPKAPRGVQNVGDVGGSQTKTISVAQLPAHSHSSHVYSANIDLEGAGVPDPASVGLPTIPSSTGSTGGGQPLNVMPPFVVFSFVIVAR